MNFDAIINGMSNELYSLDFYNPRISMLRVSVSALSGTLQINIAKSLNPDHKGKPEKGMKMFDHEHPFSFSLSPAECSVIIRAYPELMKGTYKNPNPKEDKNANAITVNHFRENSLSKLVIDRTKDRDGRPTGSIILVLIAPGGNYVQYPFRPEEMDVFMNFVRNVAQNLPYDMSLISGLIKAVRKINWDERNKNSDGNSGGGNSGGGYQKNNNQGGGYQSGGYQKNNYGNGGGYQKNNYRNQPAPPAPEDTGEVATFDDGYSGGNSGGGGNGGEPEYSSVGGDGGSDFDFGF